MEQLDKNNLTINDNNDDKMNCNNSRAAESNNPRGAVCGLKLFSVRIESANQALHL